MTCEQHTDTGKIGYIGFHEVAEKLHRKGYRQRKCSGCGLWSIWFHKDTKEFLTSFKSKIKLI